MRLETSSYAVDAAVVSTAVAWKTTKPPLLDGSDRRGDDKPVDVRPIDVPRLADRALRHPPLGLIDLPAALARHQCLIRRPGLE